MKHERSFMVLSFVTGLLILSAMFVPVSVSKKPINNVDGAPPGWSDDININNDPLNDKYPAIAIDDENIHIVWVHDYFDLVYSKSNDGGRNWDPFITLCHSAGIVMYPDIAVSGQMVHVVWDDYRGGDSTTYYRNSSDGGVSWNPEKKLPSSSTYAGGSNIYVNNTNLHVVWNDWRDGSDGEVYYRRSLDGGITFDNGQGVDEDRRITFSPSVVTKPLIAGFGLLIQTVSPYSILPRKSVVSFVRL